MLGENLQIYDIAQIDDRTLQIHWNTGKTQNIDVVTLRRQCPCAACIDEWTRKPLLNKDSVPDSVRPEEITSIGRYAIGVKFDDGHSTGIYTYDLLSKL